ncbi:MAG TPA: GumC family protein, partial [Candidatus Dormibacteraeota bacterium]|nr:GumC family protein [Candidatus Dormibacteraeota bacterium]
MDTAVFDHYGVAETRTVLPGQVVRTLSRRWLLLALCGLIGGSLGLAVASQMTPTYTASGDIVIDLKSFAIPELQGAISGQGSADPLPAVRTAAIDLASPALLESVVEQLHLTNYCYFNDDLCDPTLIGSAIGEVKSRFPFLFSAPPKHTGQEAALAALSLSKRLTIFYDNRSLAVTASVVLPDPQLASQIVNAILNRYIALQGNSRVEYNTAASVDIMQHLGDVRKQVDTLDAKARDLRAQNGLVTLNPSGSLGQQRLSELGTLEAQAVAQLQQLEAKLALATQLTAHGNAAELADVLSSQTISRLRDQQSLAAQHLARLDATVVPGSRLRQATQAEYQQVQIQIAAEAQRIVKSLSEQVASARGRVQAATAALDQAAGAAAKASLVQADIAQVEKEAESRRQVYQALLTRASQTAVSPEVARQSPGVYVGSPAVVPVLPSGPHTKIVAALGMLAGLMAGSVVAIKRSRNLPVSATPDEIASYVRVPLLGVIPVSRRQPLEPVTARWSPAAGWNPQDQALGLLYSRLRNLAAHQGQEVRSVLFIAAEG